MVKKIREIARKLLEEGKVDVVLGYEKGTEPLSERPFVARTVEEVERLTYSPFAIQNLATYLPRFNNNKVAILARGCTTRAINVLISEGQIERDKIYVIGIPCNGVIKTRELRESIGEEIEDVGIQNGEIVIKTTTEEKKVKFEDWLNISCKYCEYPNPLFYDVLVGEEVKPRGGGYPDVEDYEKLDEDKRWEIFEAEMSKCVRCYACRQSCPMCYCEHCFVDSTEPRWVEPGFDKTDLESWHLIRVLHMAGRCVDCGTCELVCPEGVKLLFLTRKVARDLKRDFDYVSGLNPEKPPFFGEFRYDDKGDFIL